MSGKIDRKNQKEKDRDRAIQSADKQNLQFGISEDETDKPTLDNYKSEESNVVARQKLTNELDPDEKI
jgi:hypothetical protein